MDEWIGNEFPSFSFGDSSLYYYFEKRLIYSLKRHRYPVLNQLNALNTLVNVSLIRAYLSNEKDALQNTTAWLQELWHINEKYNHPLHFTPVQMGSSLYLYWFLKSQSFQFKEKINDFNLEAEAGRFLEQSLDMCHMGRGYYQAINKMYYLYDDFNDNQIHRNHALQMAGRDLTHEALIKLRSKSRR
ncbi:hypothetical protein ACQE3E_08055 [Methylomonas sp. MED-D]|uniref:hypothetical protein n=1 Tax=Methylomonas sp. MED-D TaxID=3418768 RepID=UPI003D033E40